MVSNSHTKFIEQKDEEMILLLFIFNLRFILYDDQKLQTCRADQLRLYINLCK